ncbi:dihydrofolate reductase family protein [Dactylosporangium sp. NPDC000521]|uniref:dihydrofolate reductase family protein n=1 Tax=Dactylosporangium sp. NPDC000521 TaxID=3363975 RepID=UPI00369A1AFE
MSLTQYYVATTLDGFIADRDHSLQWLFTARSDSGGPPGYRMFISSVGAIAMGANTYEWIVAHASEGGDPADAAWPYDQPSWVFSHRELPRLRSSAPIVFTSGDVATVHPELLAAAMGRNVWVMGGGDLAGQFADAGLLDELLVAIAPTTLGAGAALLPRPLDLTLRDVRRDGDFACLRYAVGGRRGHRTE